MKRFCILVLVTLMGIALPASAYLFDPDTRAIDSTGIGHGQTDLDLVVEGDNTHLVFLDDRDDPADTVPEVYYVRRNATGAIDQTLRLSDGILSNSKGRPRITSLTVGVDTYLFVVFMQEDSGNADIVLRRSEDGGATWQPAVQVHQDAHMWASEPVVTAIPGSPDRIVVAWVAFISNPVLRSNYSLDHGDLWESSDILVYDGSPRSVGEPAIDHDDAGRIYLAFALDDGGAASHRTNVVYSDNDGLSYNHSVEFVAVQSGEDHSPDITAWGDGNVAVAWSGDTQQATSEKDILFTCSRDGAVSWPNSSIPAALCEVPSVDDSSPRLTNDGGTVHCAYTRDFGSVQNILFGTFAPDLVGNDDCIRVDQPTVDGNCGATAIDRGSDGRIAVGWIDLRDPEPHPYHAESPPSLADPFDDLSQWPGAVAVTIDCTRSVDYGGCSARMGDSTKAEGLLEHAWPQAQNGTVVFWFWDGYTGLPGDPYMVDGWWGGVRYDDGTKAGVVRTLGIVNPGSTYSTQGESGTEDTGVDREEGWHKVEVKSEKDEGKAPAFFIYLDDMLVYQDTSFPYFEELLFQGGSGDAPYNVDELNCYTEDDDDSPPEAPALSGFGILILAGVFGVGFRRRKRAR